MKSNRILSMLALLFGVTLMLLVSEAAAQQRSRDGLREPVYRIAQRNPQAARPGVAKQAEHPLAPARRRAEEALKNLKTNVKDYSATLVKRERINGVLMDQQFIYTKIRREQTRGGRVVTPFSVYMYFRKPDTVKGREVLYVKGRNDGKLIAHDGGTGLLSAIKSAVTVNLDPNSDLAMRNQKYPITDVGLDSLLRKLIEVAKHDMKFGECDVQFIKGATINGRKCTILQTTHPKPRKEFRFHIARIFIDDELNLPIRYASYDWPKAPGAAPALHEEYTYLNLKLNQGFTDVDFDRTNPRYSFN